MASQKWDGSTFPGLGEPSIKDLRDRFIAEKCGQRFLANLLVATRGVLALLVPLVASNNTRMCNNYGHLAPRSWNGPLPKCSECGVVISDSDQLRGSLPRRDPVRYF